MQSNLFSTNYRCAKQLIFHTPQLCTTTYYPHITAVHNNLLSTHHSCTQQFIVQTPQLCTTTYCPHATAVQNNLLSTHQKFVFNNYSCQYISGSFFCLSFAQLLHSTRIHRNVTAHVISPDKIIRISDSVLRHEGVAVSPRLSVIFPDEFSVRFIT